jgi:hypothetical protein
MEELQIKKKEHKGLQHKKEGEDNNYLNEDNHINEEKKK